MIIQVTPFSPPSTPVLRMSVPEGTVISNSLIMALNSAYIFHQIAREPQKVVPPGKSLLSVLPGLEQELAHLLEIPSEKLVQKAAHQTFWDQVITSRVLVGSPYAYFIPLYQVLQALSSPLSSSQISRLKGLYKDLHGALTPLFPPNHPALVNFSLPLPPTSSPLLSAVAHLHDTLLALRQRCAPVRDATIDDIVHQIHHRSPSASTEELAELLVNVIRSTLELSKDMRNDYSHAVWATSSEQELADMVATIAETQEQNLVLQLWESKEVIRKEWTWWMEGFRPADPIPQVQSKQLWILKLVESLGKPHAVASKLFGPSHLRGTTSNPDNSDPDAEMKRVPEPKNMLPPQLLLSGPTLFHLQNHIQALTIAASLKSLVPTPHTTSPPSQLGGSNLTSPANWTFTKRIWALLEPEIGETGGETSETKIVNLADEVVMAHSRLLAPGVATLDAHLEQRLRGTVDRILRTDDPVFALLQKRLLAALAAALTDIPISEEPTSVRMQSGRSQHPTRGTSSSPHPQPESVLREVAIVAKGFEDPVIAKQCSIVASTLRRSVEWVERVWGDTMPYHWLFP